MRNFAVLVNFIQIFIVLGLLLIHGFALGATTFLAIFVLLFISLVNLLVLLFHTTPADSDHITKSDGQKSGLVKRQDLRVLYKTQSQPLLTVSHRRFPVLDLSENGMRISIDRKDPLKKRFRGQLILLSKQILPLQLTIVRRQRHETALLFAQPIDYTLLLTEKQLAGK